MTSWIKIAATLAVLATAGLGGTVLFYSGRGPAGNSACSAARETVARLKPLARGEVAAVQVADRPAPAPELAFLGPQGEGTTLAAFRGRTVLVNLWATWCPPCLQEMPALDVLQAKQGGADFAVVAINIDTRQIDRPKAWLAERKIANLGYYADPEARVFQVLRAAKKVEGMPVSMLIDPAGCELALLQGPAEWSSADAAALIEAAKRR